MNIIISLVVPRFRKKHKIFSDRLLGTQGIVSLDVSSGGARYMYQVG